MVGGNIPWSKAKLAYANEVEEFRKQNKTTSIVYFEKDAIGFDDHVPSGTSCSQINNRLMNTSLASTADHQNIDIGECVSTIADLQLQLNRCKKQLVESNQERKCKEARARSLEEKYASISDEHLKFAKNLQDTIEISDILQPNKKYGQDIPSRDTIILKGVEIRPTTGQHRVLQGKKPRAAIRQLIILLKDEPKINLHTKCYYMPGSQIEENEKNVKLKPNQLNALIFLVGKYIWLFKGKDVKARRKAIAAALDFSRQINKGKYQKGPHKQPSGLKRKRDEETANKRSNTTQTSDEEDDLEIGVELDENETLEDNENEEEEEYGDILLDENEQYSEE
jgi:hypothetical protein